MALQRVTDAQAKEINAKYLHDGLCQRLSLDIYAREEIKRLLVCAAKRMVELETRSATE